MKYCEEYAALLDLYVDGELAAEEMARVQAHLDGCPGCQAYVDDALIIRAAFPGVEDIEMPEGFAGGVMERIRMAEAEKAKRKTRRRWLGALVPLAACCAVVILLQNGPGMAGGDNFKLEAADMDMMGGEARAAAGAAGCDTGADEDSGLEAYAEATEDPGPRARSDMEAPKAANYENVNGSEDGGFPMEALDGAAEENGEYDYGNTVTSARPSIAAQAPAASPEGKAQELAPEPAMGLAGKQEAVLTLTAEEAGRFLEGWELEEDDGGSRWYRITAEQYQELLAALAAENQSIEAKETEVLLDGTMFVEVTGPF